MVKWINDHMVEIIVIMIIIVITACTIIVACINESHRISEGTVVDRDYSARCTLTISGMKDGEEVEYTFEVPEAEYVKYNIGDHYPKED